MVRVEREGVPLAIVGINIETSKHIADRYTFRYGDSQAGWSLAKTGDAARMPFREKLPEPHLMTDKAGYASGGAPRCKKECFGCRLLV